MTGLPTLKVEVEFGTRRNLCANPSAEVDASSSWSWLSGGAPTATRVAGGSQGSSWCFQLNSTGALYERFRHVAITGLTPGTPFTMALDAKAVSGGTSWGIALRNPTGDVLLAAAAVAIGGAYARTSLTAIVPASGSIEASVYLNAAGASVIAVDSILLENVGTVGSYFDGSTSASDAAWTGAAGLSTSTLINFVDLTSSINLERTEITSSKGRGSKSDDGQPGTFSCVFENTTGALTPDNPASAYYPFVVEGRRLRYTAGGVVRFYGQIVTWEPSYSNGVGDSDAVVAVTAKDSIGTLADTDMRTSLFGGEAVLDGASALYELTTDFADTSGQGGQQLAAVGAGSRPSFVTASAPGVGGIGPSWEGNILSSGQPITAPLAAWPRTVECWINTAYPSAWLWSLTTGPPDGINSRPGLYAGIAADGTVGIYRGTSVPLGGTLLVSSPSAITNLAWTHVVATMSGTTVTLYINGDSVASAALSDIAIAPTTATFVGAQDAVFITLGSVGFGQFVGSACGFAIYPTALTAARIASHYSVNRYLTESASSRVARICSYAGVKATGSGGKAVGWQQTAGKTALEAVQLAMRGDSRIVYDAAGTLQVRTAIQPTAVSATFDAEADLDAPPVWQRSSQGRYSRVTATSPTLPEESVPDPTAPASNTATIDTALASALDLAASASREISDARDAKLRMRKVSVDLVTAANAITTAALALVPGDRVRVQNLPTTVIGWSYQDGYVLGWQEQVGIDHHKLIFDLEPADAPAQARADDTTRDRAGAGAGVLTLAAAITAAATSAQVSSTSVTLTLVAGNYPLDLDFNGERITVTAAPVSAVSPQTVTITRGVAPSVARAHSAGEPIDVWLGGARAAY